MGSLYLNRLPRAEYDALKVRLAESQKGMCFICGKEIDLALQGDTTDVDHVVPTKMGGKDDPTNFALTHSSCNRSKQDAHLEVARVLYQFENIRESLPDENRGPNLNDILIAKNGARNSIKFIRNGHKVKYSLSDLDDNSIREAEVITDPLSGFEYFFVVLPIEYLHHDDKINPRSIGQNISKLVKEFYLKRPQLHISLAWINLQNGPATQVKIFDGQHKAAAQILLGVRRLPVRVFINPNLDILLTTTPMLAQRCARSPSTNPYSDIWAVPYTWIASKDSRQTLNAMRMISASPNASYSSTSGVNHERLSATSWMLLGMA